MQHILGYKKDKKIFLCVPEFLLKKKKKKNLSTFYDIYDICDIFFLLNKLKFDDRNISTKLLIREQTIINNCPSDKLISLTPYV